MLTTEPTEQNRKYWWPLPQFQRCHQGLMNYNAGQNDPTLFGAVETLHCRKAEKKKHCDDLYYTCNVRVGAGGGVLVYVVCGLHSFVKCLAASPQGFVICGRTPCHKCHILLQLAAPYPPPPTPPKRKKNDIPKPPGNKTNSRQNNHLTALWWL